MVTVLRFVFLGRAAPSEARNDYNRAHTYGDIRVLRSPCFMFFLFVLGCESNRKELSSDTTAKTQASDSVVYENWWNMGTDLDEPEKNFESRFAVRVTELSSGTLTVYLDSASSTSAPEGRKFFLADSVAVTGLTKLDKFTQGCTYGAGPWQPRIGVMRDSVYERSGRPRFIWVLDTLNARIRPVPTDSASCFIAGPE